MESINEATLLYVMAADLLGPRPLELGECNDSEPENIRNYSQIENYINAGKCFHFIDETESVRTNNHLRGTQTIRAIRSELGSVSAIAAKHPTVSTRIAFGQNPNTSPTAGTVDTGIVNVDPGAFAEIDAGFRGLESNNQSINVNALSLTSFSTSLLKQSCVFCIPSNPDLLSSWDRVDDRLYKIRNCLNISGVSRQLALFAPEIDPRLLVRARAAGLSIEDVLNSISGNLPPYRFSFLIVKAKEYAGALQSFGAALLGATEKQEAEYLAQTRLRHQNNILDLTTKLRDKEIEAAQASLEVLRTHEQTVMARKGYYESLLKAGLSEWEIGQISAKIGSNSLLALSIIV